MLTAHITDTTRYLDVTPRIIGGSFSNGPHGDEDARLALRMPAAYATALFQSLTMPDLIIADSGAVIYRGRIEEIEIAARETTMTAYGYWRALADARYTALWSHSGTADWRPVRTTEVATRAPDRYTFDTNNRLYIAPNKGAVHFGGAGTPRLGSIAYRAPNGGSRVLTTLSLTYNVVALSADWVCGWNAYSAAPGNAAWTNISGATIVTGSGTGSTTITLPANTVAIQIWFYQATGVAVAQVAETGTYYAIMTNVRVTSQATPILLSNIAADMVSAVTALNSTQLSASTARIATTTTDRYEEVYEDADPRAVLERLALAEGNWECGVDREQRLYLHAPGTFARTWAVERADLRLTRITDDVANRVYAIYQESDGYPLRTTAANNTSSQTRYGVIRQTAVNASQTTSSTQATAIRDAYLTDNATPPPRAAITIPRGGLATDNGGRAPGYLVQHGDTLRIRQLPPDLAIALDQLSTFRVGRRTYDLATGVTTIEPLNPPDTLPVLLAQRENANRRIAETGEG